MPQLVRAVSLGLLLLFVSASQATSISRESAVASDGSWGPAVSVGDYMYTVGTRFDLDRFGRPTPTGTFTVVDVSDRENPHPIAEISLSSCASPDPSSAPTHDNGTIFFGCFMRGINAVDVRNPTVPVNLGLLSRSSDSFLGLHAAEGWLYLADLSSGLRIFNASTPSALVEVGTLPTVSGFAVHARGDLLYVVSSDALVVVDIANRSRPVELTRLPLQAGGVSIHATDSRLYLARGSGFTREGGVDIVDISVPTAPRYLGTALQGEFAADVAGGDDVIFVLQDRGVVRAADVSDPAAPKTLGAYLTFREARSIELVDGLVRTGSRDGIEFIDVAVPAWPTQVGVLPMQGPLLAVSVEGTTAFLADGSFGMRVVDLSAPELPVEIATYQTPYGSADVDVSNGIAYLASGDVYRLDVSDPTNPSRVRRIRGGRFTLGIDLVGSFAYLIGSEGLRIFDFSDPTPPLLVGSVDLPGSSSSVAISGEIAVVASPDPDAGLLLVDISDPSAPVLTHILPQLTSRAVDVAGDVAYVATKDMGLQLVDLANPAQSPVSPGLAIVESSDHISVHGDYAYYGSTILDVSTPLAPRVVGAFPTAGWVSGVAPLDDLTVYVGRGLEIVDLGPEYRRPLEVRIDIRPGKKRNKLRTNSRGLLAVAILGGPELNVRDVDASGLRFGPNEATAVRNGVSMPRSIRDLHITTYRWCGKRSL